MPIKVTITQAFLKFFGKKEGQSMSDFSQEIKAALASDRPFWVREFQNNGFEIADA